jgi:hypothetical protein
LFGSDDQTTTTSSSADASAAGSGCTLQVDPSVSGMKGLIFSGVTSTRAGVAWAVGAQYVGSQVTPSIQRWDGSAWKPAAGLPDTGPINLEDVTAVGPTDVWGVGSNHVGAVTIHGVASTWSVVQPIRVAGADESDLIGVAARSADDIWAVGRVLVDHINSPLIERWNGSTWSLVPGPKVAGRSSGLKDVAVEPGGAAWAVGWNIGTDRVVSPLIERWDGSAWKVAPVPPVAQDATLSGVAVIAADDAFAVGWSWERGDTHTLVLHWDGSAWTAVTMSGPHAATARLAAVVAAGDGAFAVGQAPDAGGIDRPVAFHWDGSTWTELVAAPGPSNDADLNDVTAVRAGGLIAVGTGRGDAGYQSLVERGCV